MTTLFWIAQAIGCIGLVFTIFSYQSKSRDGILNRQALGSVAYVAHYFLLSAWTGAIINALVFFRNLIFVKKNTHAWARHKSWLYVFMVLAVATLPFTWQGYISFLPVIALLLGVYARWHDDASRIRLFSLIGCILWIPYNIVVLSYAGLAVDVVAMVAILFGIFRYDRPQTAAKKAGIM